MKQASELERRLNELSISIDSVYQGKKESNGFENYAWQVTLTTELGSYTLPFRYGLGHSTVPRHIKRTEHQSRWAEHAIPTKPSIGDVVSCLLYDITATEESFQDWCDNFGYDTDSRKALETYLKCQENGNAIIKLLGYGLVNELRELEH